VSFSDLEGKLSRHPSSFNCYYRNVADRGVSIPLLLSGLSRPALRWSRRRGDC
jgi:hypothetical protein